MAMTYAIVVAEDEEVVRLLIAEYLIDAGFKVLEASTAAEALSCIHGSSPVDLLFSDVHMPGSMDGVALANHLLITHQELPVILTSGRAVPQINPRHKHRRFIAKPYAFPEVEKQIRELLH